MSEKQSAWRSPWVLGWVGLLVVFVMANAVMIYLAETGKPGLVVDDYYERGQHFERNMLKKRAAHPGWKMRVIGPERTEVGEPATFGFRVNDAEGNPVSPETATFYAYRPSGSEHDFSVPMRLVKPGYFEADVAFPLLGVWDILVAVKHGEYEFTESYRLSAGVN